MGEDATAGRTTKHVVHIIVAMFLMLMLIWMIYTGYNLATQASRDSRSRNSDDGDISLIFGVATVVFGSVYFIFGATIVAELALDLSAWLKTGKVRAHDDQEEEQNTICQVVIQTSVTVVSMIMLVWAIYHGCKIAAAAPNNGMQNCLGFIIGFITMAFGIIYFIIGIGIVTESALCLATQLQQQVSESEIYSLKKTNIYLAV